MLRSLSSFKKTLHKINKFQKIENNAFINIVMNESKINMLSLHNILSLTCKHSYQFSSTPIGNKLNDIKQIYEASFDIQQQQQAEILSTPKSQQKKEKYIIKNPQINKLAKQLETQVSYFIAPLYHSKTYHYASFLLQAVRLLHQKNVFQQQNLLKTYFRQVKNILKSNQNKLFTPRSALKLMQQFSLIDFDGDQSSSLEKILIYVQQNYLQFQQIQLQRFRTAYQRIMVAKAFGPVAFRVLNIQKVYKDENQRKCQIIKKNLIKKLQISQQQLNIDYPSNKKWLTIKLQTKNMYILTYPNNYQQLSQDQIYQYIYDIKQLITTSISRSKRIKNINSHGQTKINIQIRQCSQNNLNNNNFQKVNEENIVYRKKKQVVDEIQKLKQMRKLSLKEQIQIANEKKKALRQKEKGKYINSVSLDIKQHIGDRKLIDFIQTIKYNIGQLNIELIEKTNKRNSRINRLSLKQRRYLQKGKQLASRQQDREQQRQQQVQDNSVVDNSQLQDERQNKQVSEQSQRQKQRLIQKQSRLSSQMMQKMRQQMQRYKKKSRQLKQLRQKRQEVKQMKQQGDKQQVIISQLIKMDNKRFGISEMKYKFMKQNSKQELKQLQAYLQLIQQLNNVIKYVNTQNTLLINPNSNNIHHNKLNKNNNNKNNNNNNNKLNKNNNKLNIRNENNNNLNIKQNNQINNQINKYNLIKNLLNQYRDTNISLNYPFQSIFHHLYLVNQYQSNLYNHTISNHTISNNPISNHTISQHNLISQQNPISNQQIFNHKSNKSNTQYIYILSQQQFINSFQHINQYKSKPNHHQPQSALQQEKHIIINQIFNNPTII